jgi:uncharacterized coiled-coil DUF342 family protein
MAGGKLEVQIGADITDFEKKIKEVEFDIKELSKVKLDRLKLGLDTTEINAQIKDAKNNLNGLKTAVKDTGQTFQGMAPKVANGGNALMQFSRIAQDAPFGIIGIGNNITATVEAFGHLKNSTGSTGGALKALASSIAGTGGILLGVSLLTTGLTLLAQSGLSVGDVIDKITGNFDEFGAALKKANEEAVKNSAAEISGLNALVSVAENVNLSMRDRLTAVNELQKTYPGYFGNLSKEQILNGDVKTAVEGVTQALIAKAKAQAFTGELVKLAQEQFTIEEKLLTLYENQEKLREKTASKNAAALKASGKNQDFVINAAIRNIKAIDELGNEITDYENKLRQNAQAQQKWTDRINENVAASIKLREEIAKPTKTTPLQNRSFSAIPQLIVPAPLVDANKIEFFNGQIDSLGRKVKELPGIIKASMLQASIEADLGAVKLAVALADFNARAGEIIQGAIADTFAGLGSAIGDALANGGSVLQSIGASLLDSLGSLLVQMGKMAIQVGVGLLAIKTALKSLNPAVAIGAGVALVALGSFFSSKSRSIGGSIGGGGSVSGGSGSGANNQSFTSGGFASRGDGGGTVVFEIAGQKLIGVLSNTLNANRRLGGSLGL